jgi:CspA family cold shock protein
VFGTAKGNVVEFDERRGLGVVADDDGTRYPFHCTQIADGSRTIEVGTTVTFQIAAGVLGRLEASSIEPSDH